MCMFDDLIILFYSKVPALNFAYHCETPVSPEYPFLLRCPEIEKGIKECQKRGKRVLMSIGGATGDGTLPDADKAKEFARTLFDLFLGGSRYQKIRPFGRYVRITLVYIKVEAKAILRTLRGDLRLLFHTHPPPSPSFNWSTKPFLCLPFAFPY